MALKTEYNKSMTEAINQKLYEDFLKIVESGTEQEAKDFLVEHLKEFSQEEQNEIIVAFLGDAIKQQASDETAVADFQKKAVETFEALVEQKKDLEKKAKLLELKEKI